MKSNSIRSPLSDISSDPGAVLCWLDTIALQQDAQTFFLWWAGRLFVQVRLQSESTGKISKPLLRQCQVIGDLLIWATCAQPNTPASREVLTKLVTLQIRLTAYCSTITKQAVGDPPVPTWLDDLDDQWTLALEHAAADLHPRYARYARGVYDPTPPSPPPELARCIPVYRTAWQRLHAYWTEPLPKAPPSDVVRQAEWVFQTGWKELPTTLDQITIKQVKPLLQRVCNEIELELFISMEALVEESMGGKATPTKHALAEQFARLERIRPFLQAFSRVLEDADLEMETWIPTVSATRTVERLTNWMLTIPGWSPEALDTVKTRFAAAHGALSRKVVARLETQVNRKTTWAADHRPTKEWLQDVLQDANHHAHPFSGEASWAWSGVLFRTAWQDDVVSPTPKDRDQALLFGAFLDQVEQTTGLWTRLYATLHRPANTTRWAELIARYATKLDQEVFFPITSSYLELFRWAVQQATSPAAVVDSIQGWVDRFYQESHMSSLGLATERTVMMSVLDDEVFFYTDGKLCTSQLQQGQPTLMFQSIPLQDVLNYGLVRFKDRVFGVLAPRPKNPLVLGWTYMFEAFGLHRSVGFPVQHTEVLTTGIIAPVGLGRVDMIRCDYTVAQGRLTNLALSPALDHGHLHTLPTRVQQLLINRVESMLQRLPPEKRHQLLGYAALDGPRTVVIPHYLCCLSVATESNLGNTTLNLERAFSHPGQLEMVLPDQLETVYLDRDARWWSTSASGDDTFLAQAHQRRAALFQELQTICGAAAPSGDWQDHVAQAFQRYQCELYLRTYVPDAFLMEQLLFYVLDPPEFRNRAPLFVRWHTQSHVVVDLHTVLHNTLLTFNAGQVFRLTQEHSVAEYRQASDLNLLLFFLMVGLGRVPSPWPPWEPHLLHTLYRMVLLVLTKHDWVTILEPSAAAEEPDLLACLRQDSRMLVSTIQRLLPAING